MPSAGIINNAVVKKIVFLPPAKRMKKLLGILKLAPVSPAIADSVNNSAFANGKPRLSICTVMTLQ